MKGTAIITLGVHVSIRACTDVKERSVLNGDFLRRDMTYNVCPRIGEGLDLPYKPKELAEFDSIHRTIRARIDDVVHEWNGTPMLDVLVGKEIFETLKAAEDWKKSFG